MILVFLVAIFLSCLPNANPYIKVARPWHPNGMWYLLELCTIFREVGRYSTNMPDRWASRGCFVKGGNRREGVWYQPFKFHFQQLNKHAWFLFLTVNTFSLSIPQMTAHPHPQHCSSSGKGRLGRRSEAAVETERYKRGIELPGFVGRDCLSSGLKPVKCSPLFYTLAETAFYTPLAIFVLDLQLNLLSCWA